MSNYYDEKYDIRLAKETDIKKIMNFIDKHWKKNHILSQNKDFFEYQHKESNNVNYIIALDKFSKEIEGILGFIYSSNTVGKRDIWGAIWKVRDDHKNTPFLGVELKKRLKDYIDYRYMLGIGANPNTTIKIMDKIFKCYCGKMQHFYMLSKKSTYSVAVVLNYRESDKTIYKPQIVQNIKNIDELNEKFAFECCNQIPYKDNWYINHRYFKHPVYHYDIYGIGDFKDSYSALIVCREIVCNGVKILRIIDYIGEQKSFSGLAYFFENKTNEYEYIDMYCSGLEKQYIEEAGFVELDKDDSNIIPNNFEPLELVNRDIWIYSSEPSCIFFKGDGDQDRPS